MSFAVGAAAEPARHPGPVLQLELQVPDAIQDARLALNRGDPHRALARLRRVDLTAMAPRFHTTGLHYRCVALLQLYRYQAALPVCKKTRRRQGYDWRHSNNLAAAYMGMQQFEKAISLLESSVDRFGRRPALVSNLERAKTGLQQQRLYRNLPLRELILPDVGQAGAEVGD